MKNWIEMGILVVLVIGMVLMSGCTSSQSTATSTATAAPTTYQPPSDRDIIQLGIADAEKRCVDLTPRDAPTDKCFMTSSDKDKMANLIIQKMEEKEQNCLKTLPRSKDISLCSVIDENIRLMGWHTATTYIIQSPSTNPSPDADTDMNKAVDWSIRKWTAALGTESNMKRLP